MPTDHRTPIRESYERRIAQMRAMLALRSYTVGDLPDDATALVITYDERGAGWSEFFHSWGKENASDESNDRTEWPLSEEDHETVAEWLRTFAGGWDC